MHSRGNNSPPPKKYKLRQMEFLVVHSGAGLVSGGIGPVECSGGFGP